MKNILLTFMVICLYSIGNAQISSDTELVGTWVVVSITDEMPEMPEVEKKKLVAFKQALLASKFIFKADKHFTYDIPMPEMKGMMTNVYWKLDKVNNRIFIQEWQDKDKSKPLLMEIIIVKSGDKIFFVLEESFMTLDVKKLVE